ncbi:hypothetical protein PENSPDRAFT_226589 [Peniophora sp. CONT]|nr:hypothetical protein PENSPDRAFT_226589 [Peniophora sp. CONT]
MRTVCSSCFHPIVAGSSFCASYSVGCIRDKPGSPGRCVLVPTQGLRYGRPPIALARSPSSTARVSDCNYPTTRSYRFTQGDLSDKSKIAASPVLASLSQLYSMNIVEAGPRVYKHISKRTIPTGPLRSSVPRLNSTYACHHSSIVRLSHYTSSLYPSPLLCLSISHMFTSIS